MTSFVAVGHAWADDAAPVAKLLAEPEQLAAWLGDRDPMVESQRAKIAAAAASARQTRVIPNPTLNLGVSDFVLGQTNNSTNSPATPRLGLGETLIYTAGVDELIEIGKREPRQNAADTRHREASETAVGTLGSRLSDATQNLGKLAYVAAKRTVVATNLEAAKKLMDSEKKRVDLKDLSPLEFARIELDTEEIELQLTRADADLATAIATCAATLFAQCNATGLDASTLDAAAPLGEAIADPTSAIETRPARVASKLEGDALNWDAKLAHNRRIPDPTIGVGYTLDNLTVSGDQHQSLLFSVGIPLPLFDRGDHDEAAARANARSIAAEDAAAVRDARGQVEALIAQRAALEATLAKLEHDAIPKSTQIIQQTKTAFDLKDARLADLLLVERSHRDLLLEVLETRFDLFTVRAQLRQQLGLDDKAARGAGNWSKP
jgi:cobalt-zinc-cadmium efflux system outer membrane protein